MDALSDLLRVVRMTSALFLAAKFTSPWCLLARGDGLREPFKLGAEHVIDFHLVTEGNCWAQLAGGEAMHFGAGDLIIVAHDDPHVLGAGAKRTPVPAAPLLAGLQPHKVFRLDYGGGGEATGMVCGFLACDRQLASPLLNALPRLLKVHVGDSVAATWIASSVKLQEKAALEAGSACVLAKLAELSFIEAIRLHIQSLPREQTGWLAGLRDRFVGRALALMHEEPARSWNIDELGREVGLSRSALAQRFTGLIGQPPMQYLSSWRLRLAAHELCSSDRNLGAVAEAAGYESETGFIRAFKREFGKPPATWRREAAQLQPLMAATAANIVV